MGDTAKLANHAICTLASVMRDCKSCPFNPENVLKHAKQVKAGDKQKESKNVQNN